MKSNLLPRFENSFHLLFSALARMYRRKREWETYREVRLRRGGKEEVCPNGSIPFASGERQGRSARSIRARGFEGQTIMNIEQIAKVTHETNRAYCAVIGDDSQKSWEDAEQWQRESAVKGVEFALSNPDVTPESQHEAWSQHKLADGWKYGPVKDADKKEHPCLVPYNELPLEQQLKDGLFRGVVLTLKD